MVDVFQQLKLYKWLKANKADFHVIGVCIVRWWRNWLWLLVQRGMRYSRFGILRYYAYESGAMEA
jgi:hypothetical protein